MADAPAKQNPALQVLQQLKELWGKQSKGRRTIAVLALLGVIGFVAVTTVFKKTESWTAVAESVGPADQQNIFAKLTSRGLHARLNAGKVEVEDADIDQARAISVLTIGAASMPSLENVFKDPQLGRTATDEQVAYKRALQGELARNIIELS
ncbi:MAG TPA: hypothetical protein VGC41_26265, partial [Kofleriaceae bacterium]